MRALRAAWPAVALQLAVLVLATVAHGQIVHETDGIHWWPGRTRVGPEKCATADTRQGGHGDGTCAYFSDAKANTAPMVCPGGTGAYCCHQHGEWDCGSAGCTLLGGACTTGATCCTGICIGSVCAVATTTTTVTTTTTTVASTTTTTIAGGICTPDAAVPVAQRALRTVATSGTCQANFLPFCDVRNYGAKGDGTTDDSAAFAAAITACCTGGTVYVPRTATFPSFYKVVHGFNNDESCFFNLLGDGATPHAEVSAIHLTTAINTNCVTGPPRTCDALFDLNTGWAQDIALQGPNAFAVNPGVDNENSDGFHNATLVTRVEVTRFTTALEFTNIIRDSTITNDFIGALDPKDISRSAMNAHNYANVYFDGLASGFASHYSSYDAAPYLWKGAGGANTITSDNDTFTSYGNAGIALTGGGGVSNLRLRSLPPVQNNLYKLPAVAVDTALHLGTVQGRNILEGTDTLINAAGNCLIDNLQGTIRFIETNAPAVEISGTCTLTAGSNASFTVCNTSETQCMPQALVSLAGGGDLSVPEGANLYAVAGSGTHVIGIKPTAGACAHFVGQHIELLFTGTITVDHQSGSSTCNISLNGGGAFAAVAGNVLRLVHNGTRWQEEGRGTAP